MKTCPKCGTKNLNNNNSCDECGTSLEQFSNHENFENVLNNSEIANQLKTLSDKLSQIELNTKNGGSVAIADINMTFESMVVFMIKWAIATIPAAIILFLLGLIFMALFGGLFAALLR
jgi:uncharacterized membrane protein YvbJ